MNDHALLDLLIEENVGLLHSGCDLLGSIPASLYAHGHANAVSGGVGRHFRHILEFYELVVSCSNGEVDYEARRRDPRVEQDVRYAVDLAGRIVDGLRALGGHAADEPLVVSTEVRAADGTPVVTRSSLGRELATLASHTVHHYAIIALHLRAGGVDVPAGFGVAPSTLRHLAAHPS